MLITTRIKPSSGIKKDTVFPRRDTARYNTSSTCGRSTESRGDPIPDENLESWKSNDPEWTWIDRCRSPRIDFHPPTISLPHRFPSNASVPPRRSPPRLRTLRDRPIRIIYSRVNHNRHGRAIGRLRNDKHQQEYRPRFSFFSSSSSSAFSLFFSRSSLELVLFHLLLLLPAATWPPRTSK